MTDLEFATAISPQIGDFYAQSKAYRTLAPRSSLVLARSVGAECCDLIAELDSRVLKRRETIDSRIRELKDLGLIDGAAKQLLDAIRVNGNQGAHPESSMLAEERLPSMALVALQNCRSLFERLWPMVRPGEVLPVVEVSNDDPGVRQQMCQRATLEDDAEAQHLLWRVMKDKAAAIYAKTRAEAVANNGGMIGGAEFEKAVEHAAFWSKQAADSGYPPAMHQRGVVLAAKDDKGESAQGVAMVRAAADLGEPDSMALIGSWHAWGDMGFELDYAKARGLFEAVGSHPIALAELGRLYLEGLGIERDEAKAFDFTLQSAEAGFADGQFAAFNMMIRGQGGPVNDEGSLKWLRLAADQGHLKALIALARILRMQRNDGLPGAASFDEIAELLRRGMPDLNEMKLEMVELLLERGNSGDVVNAASLLHQCYQIAVEDGHEEVANMCVAAAPRVTKHLELAILAFEYAPDVPKRDKVRTRRVAHLFDEHGHPRIEGFPREPTDADEPEPFDAVKMARFKELARIKHGIRQAAKPAPRVEKVVAIRKPAKTGPNDPCPCGGGKKFKRCHGKG
jgi:TPR repeat protein